MAKQVLSEVTAYLDKKGVPYEVLRHKEVYLAKDLAKACKVKEQEIVKVLLMKSDKGKVFGALLPANLMVKLKRIRAKIGATDLVMLNEKEMRGATGCPPGAAPALMGMFGLSAFLDPELLKRSKVVFRGGSYTESIRIPATNLEKLTGAEVLPFSVKPSPVKKKTKKSKAVKKSKPKRK